MAVLLRLVVIGLTALLSATGLVVAVVALLAAQWLVVAGVVLLVATVAGGAVTLVNRLAGLAGERAEGGLRLD